jgi:hypothetical protein
MESYSKCTNIIAYNKTYINCAKYFHVILSTYTGMTNRIVGIPHYFENSYFFHRKIETLPYIKLMDLLGILFDLYNGQKK